MGAKKAAKSIAQNAVRTATAKKGLVPGPKKVPKTGPKKGPKSGAKKAASKPYYPLRVLKPATLASIAEELKKIKWANKDFKWAPNSSINLSNLSREYWRIDKGSKKTKDEEIKCHNLIVKKFNEEILDKNPNWPLVGKLKLMMEKWDNQGRSIGAHVVAVIASTNEIFSNDIENLIINAHSSTAEYRHILMLAKSVYHKCWEVSPQWDGDKRAEHPYMGKDDERLDWAKDFLRVSSLYHDIGKLLSNDHHVTRGIHYMRDVDINERSAIEGLFDNLWDNRCFWTVLGHHDIFGVLGTGEACLPALADIVGWTSEGSSEVESGRSTLAMISYILWLNIADCNASLIKPLYGITTIQAFRHFSDWELVTKWLQSHPESGYKHIKRDELKEMTMKMARDPNRALKRISRLISTSYRLNNYEFDDNVRSMITTLVEEELLALHGPRLTRFCDRFSRFVKLDYALRFFTLLIKKEVDKAKYNYDKNKKNFHHSELMKEALKNAIAAVCAILDRIVAEYGHLVDQEPYGGPRLGVDMSKLMTPDDIGHAICDTFSKSQAKALRWIVDEISVWLYGD